MIAINLIRRGTLIPASAVLAGLALAWACGDDSFTAPTVAEPESVVLSPAEVRLATPGSTTQLTVQVLDRNGQPITGAAVRWSSGSSAVATVDSTGLATAVADGTATVTATVGGVTGTATITVIMAATDSAATDRAALAALYEATDGPNWVNNENWLTDAPLGEWFGVTTNHEGRVVALEMGYDDWDADQWISNNVSGPIPPELGSLTRLEHLQFFDNKLTGAIPPELGNLANLTTLDFASNDVSGSIPPEIASLAKLTSLNLGGNSLSGSIPAELGGLVNLTSLSLWENELTGPIPVELGGLVNLTDLNLSGNALTGPIPVELGGLANLESLDLSRNLLTGPIPAELGGLVHLTDLNLSGNVLTGPVPVELGGLANLESLDLSRNALTGPIPQELARLASVETLRLSRNHLTGEIPPQFGNLASLRYLSLGGNELKGRIPPQLGSLTSLERLYLYSNELTGEIPPQLGNLASLSYLSLSRNQLQGRIPPQLSRLTSLERLFLYSNELTGEIPQSFLGFRRLVVFRVERNTGLCVPGSSAFATWLESVTYHRVGRADFCNAADISALTTLYGVTGGRRWTDSEGWTSELPVEEWYGVTADSLGRVTELDLRGNGLFGRLSARLSELTRMTALRIGDNSDLSGRLPASLARLDLLQALEYAGTGLCVPAEVSFQDWLAGIPSHAGTGTECGSLSDRDILVLLYEATDGPNWAYNENWLTDAPLGEWHGVDVNEEGAVIGLILTENGLTGTIPPEIGKLSNLTHLELWTNSLSGPIPPALGILSSLRVLELDFNELTSIPPELGNLTHLEHLSLQVNDLTGSIPPELGNDLTGAIPPELGNLSNLTSLSLMANDLTGSIPPWLGDLPDLDWLWLSSNGLTGPIPPELGNLSELGFLRLDDNQLTGSIPPELGKLASLTELGLGDNGLTGAIPPELGGLADLTGLYLYDNEGLAGPLPSRLTELRSLENLHAGGTDLCAPSDPVFLAWLEGVSSRVRRCDPVAAYVTQAVQSLDHPVPLVAGEEGLLRVFVTAANPGGATLPPVAARFYLNGVEAHVVEMAPTSVPIPAEVTEGSLAATANAPVPGEVVQPGLEMVIEVDPEGTLDPALGVAKRLPAEGRLKVDVRTMPLFDLTVVPFLWSEDPDSTLIEQVAGMAAEQGDHELLRQTADLMPVAEMRVSAHAPVVTSSNSGYRVLHETAAIRAMEGGTGHYMGMLPRFSDVGGVAHLGERSSASSTSSPTIVHELGHNFSLRHAPCGRPALVDPGFSDPNGRIGTWGYAVRDLLVESGFPKGELVSPRVPDLMSYCGDPEWISDYHFTNALRFRLSDEGSARAAMVAAPAKSLLLWGGVNADGELFLEPAFVVDAPAALPDAAGGYEVAGRTADSRELFSLPFAMTPMADGEGRASFVFLLPVRPGWVGNLAEITLSGPDGSVALNGGTDRPTVILRDGRSGTIRGILRDQASTAAAADAGLGSLGPGAGLRVLFSRGVPDSAAWR